MSYELKDDRQAEVRVHRAAAMGDRHVPQCVIRIVAEWPDSHESSLDVLSAEFDKEAQELADALIASLPGGTLDRLIGRLLSYKASHFVVSYGS